MHKFIRSSQLLSRLFAAVSSRRRFFRGAISFNVLYHYYTKENCSNIAMKERAFLTVKLDPWRLLLAMYFPFFC